MKTKYLLFLLIITTLWSYTCKAQIKEDFKGKYSCELDISESDIEDILGQIDFSNAREAKRGTEEYYRNNNSDESGLNTDSYGEVVITDTTISLSLSAEDAPYIHKISRIDKTDSGYLFITTEGRKIYINYLGSKIALVFNELKLSLKKLE
jgi:hypothetical protein